MKSLVQLVVGALAVIVITACTAQTATSPATPTPAVESTRVDLAGIKTYLTGKTAELTNHTQKLKSLGAQYYELAQAANFDYAALWKGQPTQVKQIVEEARTAWEAASPLYEQMEGIVGGTPSLADYDVILDAGASGDEDPDNAVPFDLTLPDGRVLPKPGNLFGVTESTLWGTFAAYTAPNAPADFDNSGQIEFGEALPEANVLKASTEMLDHYAAQLHDSAQAWQPTESDAFTSLVVMVPTMSELFDSWKNSRFVLGNASKQRDFVVVSRLSDIQDILSSLQVVYQNINPLVQASDAAQSQQIAQELAGLKAFVAEVYQQEQSGKRFTPEEVDLLGAEAQNRATAVTGQIAQAAAKLNIAVQE